MAQSLQRLLKLSGEGSVPDSAEGLSSWVPDLFSRYFGKVWQQAGPWAVGSLAKGRLCPQSDIDLVFLGESTAATSVVATLLEAGIRVRSKVIEPKESLLTIADPRDRLAFLGLRPLVENYAQSERANYEDQLRRVQEFRDELLREPKAFLEQVLELRASRLKKASPLIGLLEPNLKMNAGGTRDIELLEGLLVAARSGRLGPKHSVLHPDEVNRIEARVQVIAAQIVGVRYHLGLLEGASDTLTAQAQLELFGVDEREGGVKTLDRSRAALRASMGSLLRGMDEIDRELRALIDLLRPKRKRGQIAKAEKTSQIAEAESRIKAIESSPSFALKMRNQSDRSLTDLILVKKLCLRADDLEAQFLWDSGALEVSVAGFSDVQFLVSHDQYHQLTVGAHLLRGVQTVETAIEKPKSLGISLSRVARRLSAEHWVALMWAALYHDVGKGSDRDHSIVSTELIKKDWSRFEKEIPSFNHWMSDRVRDQIVWLIENHLILSTAAFRKNAESPETWRALHEAGVSEDRIDLLTVFTAIDILATNPQAMTAWKERLLFELCQRLHQPQAKGVGALGEALSHKGLSNLVAYQFDPNVVVGVGPKRLAHDVELSIKQVQASEDEAISVRLLRRARPNRLYVRFARAADDRGLLLKCLHSLRSVGLSIRHASIHSFEPTLLPLGVYNWFEVRPPAHLNSVGVVRLQKRLTKIANSEEENLTGPEARTVEAQMSVKANRRSAVEVSTVQISENEWVFSFKGTDEAGFLARIMSALHACGASVKWARVHTWGRQADDVVAVLSLSGLDPEEFACRVRHQLSAQTAPPHSLNKS